jgi:hypothetical protein
LGDTSVAFTVVVPTGATATLKLPAGATVLGRSLRDGQLELSCGTTELEIGIKVQERKERMREK